MEEAVAVTSERYERGPQLGGGAMGEVWCVRDRARGELVAMKLLYEGASLSRLDREIALQSRLSHRSVPRVLDRGQDAGTGAPWFTMERVEGRTLAAILDDVRARRERREPTLERTWLLRAFVRLCRVVQHAHGRGVVHRDLKPENVMIGARGDVYVVDWGLAGLVGEHAEGPAGIVVGTPGYIAPEHARGDGTPARTSGDVYALGAILFELLHLEPLYPQAHPLARLTAALLEGDPLANREGACPAELARIVRTAIARDPAARFGSAEALALAVELELAPRKSARRATGASLGLAAAAAIGLLVLSPVATKAERVADAALDALGATLTSEPGE